MAGAEVNQLGPEGKTRKGIFKSSPKDGKTGPELDSTLRKPFPNMGQTKTGRER